MTDEEEEDEDFVTEVTVELALGEELVEGV
jgi:hypothetical protein